ncbi:hypothetical protein [Seonamhaeicola sp.]|uniref:hypothetical protein n=1 Tax=Seonamhaeicola sp. TaxID=1912245 RepID=UPI002613A1C6|nr:hypothetical protein [Seonamhaeicola sp.]
MKRINIKSKLSIGLAFLALTMFTISCEENTFFDYDVFASFKDGIQNGDEEGIDCGGSTGVACPSCNDGIQNQGEEGVDCGGPCAKCPDATPRADAIRNSTSSPYFYTFESGQVQSGKNLEPMHTNADGSTYSQGVTPTYGQADPAGSSDLVTKILRPANGPFGGFEDYKFQTQENPIDFSMYNKFTLDVYIPSSNDFSGSLEPMVEVILHDNVDGNFWQRWTVIAVTVDPGDFDGWVTLFFDGTNAVSADNGTLLADNTSYTNFTLRFGGSNHQEQGEFYVKDFFAVSQYTQPGTPRADVLAGTSTEVYFTFESGDETSGKVLRPMTTNPDDSDYTQGVDIVYGAPDPAGSADGVAMVTRPDDGRFGGFEDFKFQYLENNFDFTSTNRFYLDVYVPSTNTFSGNLTPTVDLILHINSGNFWETWTVITVAIDPADFDKWITIEFDGSGTLPAQTTYNSFTLRFGGAGHTESGVFYAKDFRSVEVI